MLFIQKYFFLRCRQSDRIDVNYFELNPSCPVYLSTAETFSSEKSGYAVIF